MNQVDQNNSLNNSKTNVSKEEEGSSEVMFLSYQETEEHCNLDLWLLDSGYNNHMTGNKSLFSSLDSSVVTNIKLGDKFLVPTQGKVLFLYLQSIMRRNLFMGFYMYQK